MNKLSLIVVLLIVNLTAQGNDPKLILDRVKERFEKVNDYRVDVKIKIDVDFLKVPESEAKILFKQPDKIRIKSENFAMLPKKGLNFSPLSLLSRSYTSFYEKDETYEGNRCAVVKVIPLGEAPEVVLSTLWVDRNSYVIRKVESTTKLEGTFSLELKYDNAILNQYPVPSQMTFIFDLSKMMIPRGLDGENPSERDLKKKNRMTKGTVSLSYSNYLINKGIADSEFKEKKSDSNK